MEQLSLLHTLLDNAAEGKPERWFSWMSNILHDAADKMFVPKEFDDALNSDRSKKIEMGGIYLHKIGYAKEINIYGIYKVHPVDVLDNSVDELIDPEKDHRICVKLNSSDEDQVISIMESLYEFSNSVVTIIDVSQYDPKKKCTHELLVNSKMVKNASERYRFINEFVKQLPFELSEYVLVDPEYYTHGELPSPDYYNCINVKGNKQLVQDCRMCTYFYVPKKAKGPVRRFIDHVKNDKPSWYKPGEWVSSKVLFAEYSAFDESASLSTFSNKLKVLWSEKKTIKSCMCYLMVDIS